MKKAQKLSINDIKVSSFVTSINKQDSVTVIGGKPNITEDRGCLPTNMCYSLAQCSYGLDICRNLEK